MLIGMANDFHRLGGVCGFSVRAVRASKPRFLKTTFTHVELWRDADAERGTEAHLLVSVPLTDDEACIAVLTRAEIIKLTGMSMEDAVYLRAHVHQAWKRRCRVML